MKIERINTVDIIINRHANKHKYYLYNEMMSLMQREKFGGEFGNDYITLKGMPEKLLKVLKDLQIKFERLK